MSDALEEHDGKISVGGRTITNLRFTDDIDALAEEVQGLEALVESLDKTCTRYKIWEKASTSFILLLNPNQFHVYYTAYGYISVCFDKWT